MLNHAAKQAALKEQKVTIQKLEKGMKDIEIIIMKMATGHVHEFEERFIKLLFERRDSLEEEVEKLKKNDLKSVKVVEPESVAKVAKKILT